MLAYREKLTLFTLGGPGSGNFGHAGRPGEIGGSGDGSGATDIPAGAKGECFRNAATWVREHDDFTLVHGKVTNGEGRTFDHAWAESDTEVADPTTGVKLAKDRWYGLVKAQPEAKYTSEQAAINMLRTRNLGPWTPEEVGHRHLRSLFDLGGAGSGNFGHAGRPGEVGGSAGERGSVGTKGIALRPPTAADEAWVKKNAGNRVGDVAQIGDKKDGGKLLVLKVQVPLWPDDPAYAGRVKAEETAKKAVFGDRDPAEIAGQMLEDLPGNLLVSVWKGQNEHYPDATVVNVFAQGETGPGQPIRIGRQFIRHPDGSLTVHHDSFELPKKVQGQGLARAVLADSYHAYQEMGVTKIETTANLDRGGYTWAKFGFTANKPEQLAETLTNRVKDAGNGVRSVVLPDATEAQKTGLLSLIETHKADPKLPWHVANAVTPDGQRVGKELLYETGWDATLDLKDKEAVSQFEAYIKGH